MVKASPAPLVWIIVGLLRGEFYACAKWPSTGSKCSGNGIKYSQFEEDFVLACQIPKTEPGTELDSCNAKLWNSEIIYNPNPNNQTGNEPSENIS